MERTTQLKTVERHGFGGSYYDSITHAALFRKYKPYDFGVKSAELYSSKLGSHLVNKKFTYYTVAKGNVYLLPPGIDDYEWKLNADADIDFRASDLAVDPTSQPGKAGTEFKIVLDRDWLHEPCVIKTESADLPLIRIIGYPKQISANRYEYTCKLQTSDLNAWIPVEYLQAGRRFKDVTTSVADELNNKFSGLQFGEMFKLQSFTGGYARKIEMTDKFIRMEIGCRESGRRMSGMSYGIGGKSYSDGAVGVGYTYSQNFRTKDQKMVKAGVFVTAIEARLEERIQMDREMSMEFGQLEKGVDEDSQRTRKVAPGWRQLVRDGHFKKHNGTLTLAELQEFLMEIFITRRDFADRSIKLASGEAGIEFLNRLISAEASQFNYIDSHFLQKRSDPQGYHSNELEYGSQFTKIKATNGLTIEIVYDPIKDDRTLFPEKLAGTNRTKESFSFDIYDFGSTDQKADGAKESNLTCVMQDGVEGYWSVSNVYDFERGVKKDGGNVGSNNKELGIYRETAGSLACWDTSRIGRLEW